MWEKLKQLARRYDEIGELLEVPEIYADPKKLRALTREQKELEAVVAAYRAYLKCEDDINARHDSAALSQTRRWLMKSF